MEQFIATWRRLDARRRIVLAAAATLTVAAILSLAQVATRPGMALLYSGLDPAAAGEVIGALEQMSVASEVRGDAIYVESSARDRVRLSLARDGLPRQGQAGYELLDQLSGFSSTTDMFNAAYLRAKEGELSRTILSSPGVHAARVHIGVPGRRPFARDAAPTTASVTVTMAAGRLTDAQATAIRYLVALAVADLNPDQVAVIDSRAGMVLAPGTDSPANNPTIEAADREVRLKTEIEQLLSARVGRDRSRVTVSVDTDREAETVTEKEIKPESRVTIHSDTESIDDQSKGTETNVTVASNLPAGQGGGDERSATRSESRERLNYDYSEVQRQRVRPAGTIRRISVAVLVDGITTTDANGQEQWTERPVEELEALRDLVTAAIGYDESRGDVVTVESMQFRADATPGTLVDVPSWQRLLEANVMTLVQIGVLGIVVLILALTVVRPLLSRSSSAIAGVPAGVGGYADGAMTALGRLQGHAAGHDNLLSNPALPALSGPGRSDPNDLAALTSGETLKLAVTERPEQAALMLKEWLASNEGQAA